MPKRSLLWRLIPSYALVALLALVVAGWIASSQLESSHLQATRSRLQATADYFDSRLGPEIPTDLADFCRETRRFDQTSGIRVTLIQGDGKVDCDSLGRPEEFEGQLNRPEIKQALEGRTRDWTRYNAGLDRRVFYMAVPVLRNDELFGIFYLSTDLGELDQALAQLHYSLLAAGAVLLVLAGLGARWVIGGITRPLGQLQQAISRLGNGQWSARVPIAEDRELADLDEAFNRMADQLQRQLSVLVQNNNEQKAVLASMAEGVLALDSQERVISMNMASARLLGLDQTQAQGRRLREVVRNADLSRFITRALDDAEPVEADVLLLGDRQRVMQARGSALHDVDGRAIGAVIVLNDVTDFRRLEHIRRDFVANVSHELKTPVTSIKGFVETLLDGAVNDPQDADRFLRIIAKQADRLHAIIEDLLSLSKIEQSEDSEDIALQEVPLRPVLESAVNTCQSIAQERNIEVLLACDERLQAKINPVLLEQAVVNLLDNALKYSDPGRQVQVEAAETDTEVTIRVTDHGCGIAAEHVVRIFERFYRVDRARSRKLGGTGLGLAIVKHIVQTHRGHVTVDSTPGIGSTFTIHLPKA
jgi:two-component system phosphate regulon sensor histidine kinase PhoR